MNEHTHGNVPLVKVEDIAYVVYRQPDLELIENFLGDFGLVCSARSVDRLYMRSAGPQQYVYIAERGEPSGFAGYAMRARNAQDLEKLTDIFGASPVESLDAPGGGRRVRLTDPNGVHVDVVHGIAELPALPTREPMTWNNLREKRRLGTPQRPQIEPALVQRLGHIGLKVEDVSESFSWYAHNLGLLASDVRYDGTPDKPVGIFMRCDRGASWVDHHTIVIFHREPAGIHHSSFEVLDFDALRAGHDWLEKQGWGPSWGVGRHILGSRIFDYWRDPYGNIVEHFTDGDMLRAENEAGAQRAGPDPNAVWGPPRPDWMNQ